MDSSSQFIVPTIIDVPELIVTNEDLDFDDTATFAGGLGGSAGHAGVQGWWASKLQFLSASLCYTIGLATVWRFPYLCYKHAGGAFLVAHAICLVCVGAPLLLMELAFGQYANEGPITIWRISPAFEGIGYSMCLISTLVASYYNLINTWLLQYLLATLTLGPLPWTSCENSWNTAHCFFKPEENFDLQSSSHNNCTPSSNNESTSQPAPTTLNASILANNNNNNSNNCDNSNTSEQFQFDKLLNTSNEVQLPANEFFHNHVLGLTSVAADGTTVNLVSTDSLLGQWNWRLLTGLLLLWLLVFTVLLKNLRPTLSSLSLALASSQLSNKLALAGLLMPFLSLFALTLRALTLPGASVGLSHYFQPQWERLQNIDIWLDAVTQLFHSLAPCWGGLITLANMNKFHNNFHANMLAIVLLNQTSSLAAGLAVFATLGYMATYSGIQFLEVADSGIGLIFQVFPETLAQMPLAKANAFLFFVTLLVVGITSQLTVLETVITTIVDTWPHKLRYRRPLVLVLLCAGMLLVSLPATFGAGLYLLQVCDAFAGTLTGMLIGILELIAIAWVYGMENFMQDIDDMLSIHRSLFPSRAYWYFMWRYLTPSVLFAVLLFSLTSFPTIGYRELVQLPSWMTRLGWCLSFLCAAVIPLMALIRLLLAPGGSISDKLSYLCRPSEDWAPSAYISGPKLINRHQMLDDSELQYDTSTMQHSSSRQANDSDHFIATSPTTSATDSQTGVVYTSKRLRRADLDLVSNDESTNDDDEEEEDDDDDDDEDDEEVEEEEDDDEMCDFNTGERLEGGHIGGARRGGRRRQRRRRNRAKLANGKPSYIIPEEDDEDEDEVDEAQGTQMSLISSETNV